MRRKLRSWLVLALITIVILIVSLIALIYPEAPTLQVKAAREALHKAEIAKSQQYASIRYVRARDLYDSTMAEWRRQNNIFFLKRDFSKVEYFALHATQAAIDAKSLAHANIDDYSKYIQNHINSIQLFISNYDSLIRSLPLDKNTRKLYQEAKIAFSEAIAALKIKNINQSMIKIGLAENQFSEVKTNISGMLKEYWGNYSDWKKWAENSIKHSRHKKTTSILVDKFAKKCYVYNKGKLLHTFDIELGKNWIGHKKIRNDMATPEGKYEIEKKLKGPNTIYHKALLINYPNKTDKEKFELSRKNGSIPKTAEIGGLIEIHGGGGKGVNWTNGCIALRNEEMDKIYNLVDVGTIVTIIGSQKNLKQIIDF